MNKVGKMLNIANETKYVKQQYADDIGLSARINLHTKHSTNKQSWSDWLWEQYSISKGCHILEVGCGTGVHWENNIHKLPEGCKIILSDFSEHMVDVVNKKFCEYSNVECRQIDIQNILLPDDSFDIVIANHMLYHIPDIDKALSEIKRVLKPDGVFYSSTFGEDNIQRYLHNVYKQFNPDTKAFTINWSFLLNNGEAILSRHFSNVKRLDYIDSFAITETRDLINWISSSIATNTISDEDISFDGLYEYFEDIRIKDGAIHIPKEVGMFVSF